VVLSVASGIDEPPGWNADECRLFRDAFTEESRYPTEAMEEHRLGFDADTSAYFTEDGLIRMGEATPTGESYMLYEHWGGTWCDAEKVPPDSSSSPGTGDDFMCWAGAASNVLAWTGWGLVDGMTDTDDIFQYFQDHWTDQGGMMEFGFDWWFDGTNDSQGWPGGWSQVDVPGGGFYPAENFNDYFHSQSGSSQSLAAIDEYLHAGYGVTIGIFGPGGHAITVWGYNYNPDNPSDYHGVWVTDSDDSKSSSDPPDRLRYYEVEYISGSWYLQDYYGSDAWYIDLVQALAPGEFTPTPPPAEGNEIHGAVWEDCDGDGVVDDGEQPMADQTVYLDLNNNGQLDSGGATVASDDVPKNIYDNRTIASTLSVSGGPTSIGDLNVTLDITHTWAADLEAYLVSPAGTEVELFSEVGEWWDEDFTNTTFDDEASTSITEASAPFTGTFRPEGLLSAVDGEDSNGEWHLEITDVWSQDEGTLNSWSLEITGDEPSTQTDSQGAFEFTELDDGLYYVRHDIPDGWTQTLPDSSYYALDLQDGTVAENTNFGARQTGDFVNFNDYTLYSYGGAMQDRTGSAAVENGGAALHITGNRWKAIDLSYNVTATTVLEFDFKSTSQGEVHAIGFDTDLSQEHGRTFQLYGTQTWGKQDYDSYAGTAPELKHYQIMVGQYYTGEMDYLFFVNDHDVADPTGEGVFANLQVYELEADGETTVDFANCEVNSYGGANQDRSGTMTVEDDGASLRLQGNLWKAIHLAYNVTANTVLEFDFSSTSQGEVHGIGFDADSQLSADRTFQLYGTQNWGESGYKDYAGTAPGTKHYQIEVGRYYTGQMTCLFFANDHDVANPTGESLFSNVHVYEQEADPGGDDAGIDFSTCSLESYGGATQDKTGTVTVEDGGATLHIEGNRWKAIEYSRLITPNTVLEFDFTSTGQGEVHGIGLDTDLKLSAGRTFQLYGTQTWGLHDYDDYAATAPGTKHYQIPVGQFYTGYTNYLFFANDHDVADPTGESIFSNVRVYEAASGALAKNVDFASWGTLSFTATGHAAAGISPAAADLLMSRLPDRLSGPVSGFVNGPARTCLPASHDRVFAQSIFRPAHRFGSLGDGPENLQTAASSLFDGSASERTSANMLVARWEGRLETALAQGTWGTLGSGGLWGQSFISH